MKLAATRTEQKQATREAVRSAARACFAELGYGATQIAHITARAGVAKGTFYVHYPDKDAVLAEWLAEFNEAFVARMAAVVGGSGLQNLEAAARAAAHAFLDHWTEHRDFVRVFAEKAVAGMQFEALQSGVNPQMQRFLYDALERYAAARGARLSAPGLVVQGLLALWQRLGLQFLFNPEVTREQTVHALTRMTIGAIEASFQSPE